MPIYIVYVQVYPTPHVCMCLQQREQCTWCPTIQIRQDDRKAFVITISVVTVLTFHNCSPQGLVLPPIHKYFLHLQSLLDSSLSIHNRLLGHSNNNINIDFNQELHKLISNCI